MANPRYIRHLELVLKEAMKPMTIDSICLAMDNRWKRTPNRRQISNWLGKYPQFICVGKATTKGINTYEVKLWEYQTPTTKNVWDKNGSRI